MIAPAGKVIVASPGTPVSAVTNLPASPRPTLCHGVLFQALSTNTGKVYIGTVDMDVSAMSDIFAVLAVPTANLLPSFSAALTIVPNGLNLNAFYVDTDQPDDGVLVTYLVT